MYSVPERIVDVVAPYMTPAWDEKERYCLVEPFMQKRLTREFIDISKVGPLDDFQRQLPAASNADWWIETLQRARRWVEKFGPPFPLVTKRLVPDKDATADVFNLFEIVAVSHTLRTLTEIREAWKQKAVGVLNHAARINFEIEEIQDYSKEKLLRELADDVVSNRSLNSKRDPQLTAFWTCYDDYRWEKYIVENGVAKRIRKDRRKEHVLVDAQPNRLGRFTFLAFAREAIADEENIETLELSAFKNKRINPYKLPKPQERFCERFRRIRSKYDIKQPVFFGTESFYIPMVGRVDLEPSCVSKRLWSENKNDALIDAAGDYLVQASNVLLSGLSSEISKFELRYRISCPWDAMVLYFVGMLTDRKSTARICPVCRGDMSLKRKDSKTCSEACSKRRRRAT